MEFIMEPQLQDIIGGDCTGTFSCSTRYTCIGEGNCACDEKFNACGCDNLCGVDIPC